MVGVRSGAVRSLLRRAISRCGTRYLDKKRSVYRNLVQGNYSHSPSEIKLPVETTPRGIRCSYVLECLIRNDIDDGTHHSATILNNTRQEGFQPTLGALTMRIQEGDDLPRDMFSAKQTSAYQARTFLCAQHKSPYRQFGHIFLQWFTQESYEITYVLDVDVRG